MGQGKRNGRRNVTACVILTMSLALAAWPSPGQASLFGDYWSRFDRFLATFDPAGRYVRQPIEKEIPALTFKGFYRQWSDIMLTSDKQIGFRCRSEQRRDRLIR